MIEREEIHAVVKEAVSEAMANHPCWMREEDRAVLRDIIQGSRYVKRSILMAIAGAIVFLLAKALSFLELY